MELNIRLQVYKSTSEEHKVSKNKVGQSKVDHAWAPLAEEAERLTSSATSQMAFQANEISVKLVREAQIAKRR